MGGYHFIAISFTNPKLQSRVLWFKANASVKDTHEVINPSARPTITSQRMLAGTAGYQRYRAKQGTAPRRVLSVAVAKVSQGPVVQKSPLAWNDDGSKTDEEGLRL